MIALLAFFLGLLMVGGPVSSPAMAQNATPPADRNVAPSPKDVTAVAEDPDRFPDFPDPDPTAPPARLRVYFDQMQSAATRFVEPLEPFEFYLVAEWSQVGVRGWEANVAIDPRISILEKEFIGINVGTGADWYVGIKPEECMAGPVIQLVRYKAMLTEPNLTDLVISVGPTTKKSSFKPPAPGYLVCRPRPDNVLLEYHGCQPCAVVNPVETWPVDARPNPLSDVLKPIRGR